VEGEKEMPSASISLLSKPYLGIPIEVVVANPGGTIDAWNYVAVCSDNSGDSKKRLSWEWVKDLTNYKVTLPQVTDMRAGIDYKIVLQYYVNGGYVATGDLVASLSVTLKNPLRRLSSSQQGGHVVVTADLEIVPMNAMIRLAMDGVRVATCRVDRSGSFQLPTPRVSGVFDVSFLSGIGSDMALGTTPVHVTSRERFTVVFAGSNSGGDGNNTSSSFSQAITAAPNALIRVRCGGGQLIRGKDAIFVHAVTNGKISSPPSAKEFQTPLRRCELDATGAADFQVREEGVYHVSLGLYHDAGTYLLGSRALLVVSSLAATPITVRGPAEAALCTTPRGSAPMTPQQQEQQQQQPTGANRSDSASAEDRVLCVVCRDHVIQIKFSPCRHVIVCEDCHQQLSRRGELVCPMCRARVTSFEKVFIP
jgi:hypothetical protein